LSERSQLIDRLVSRCESRASYIRGKLGVLVSAQLHALRLNREWTQKEFAHAAGMKQSRVSAMEQPGAVNFNMETLIRSAATFGVGLVVRFVPFSEMLRWENGFSQDSFDVVTIGEDVEFVGGSPAPRLMEIVPLLADSVRNSGSLLNDFTFPSQEPLGPSALEAPVSVVDESLPSLTSELVYYASQDQGKADVLALAANIVQH
jgi:transcriptional regulator with XRE-family HTH domain